MHKPPRTDLGDELRASRPSLAALERRRLLFEAPLDLDSANDSLDRNIAAVDRELTREPLEAKDLLAAVEVLICSIGDLLAATVASDEGTNSRHPVPLTSAPEMIEAFHESLKLPIDSAVAGWRSGRTGPPFELWRYQLDLYLGYARHGVSMSRLGTTVYHESEQSNQAPLVGLLAHCLSLWVLLLTGD